MQFTDIDTGDIVLTSNNTSTGFLLRTATSSMFNHAGVAIRIDKDDKVTLDKSGKLYILEINTDSRRDYITGKYKAGFGLSDVNWCFSRYNIVKIRKLHAKLRNQTLVEQTEEFIKKYADWQFPKSFLPFISVFIGVPFDMNKVPDKTNKEMFCTELVVKYYEECVGPQFEMFTGVPYSGNLKDIFGKGSSNRCDMYTPEHLASSLTPYSPILEDHEIVVFKEEADCAVVLAQPIILILIILAVVYYSIRS